LLQVSNSTLSKFKACRRSWYLNYHRQLGIKPSRRKPVGYAELGTRVHLALEAYYGYRLDPLIVLERAYSWAIQAYPFWADDLDKEHAWSRTMIEGYLTWAEETGVDAGLEVVATERIVSRETRAPDGRSITLVGKLDQLIRRAWDGVILARDWKTVGTLTKADKLLRDEQMRFYTLLQNLDAQDREDEYRSGGVLYTMLLRSKRTARAKGPFYDQVEVNFNRHDLNSMWVRTLETAQDILNVSDRLDNGEDHRRVAYPNPGTHCDWCPFVQVCHLADDGSRFEDALAGEYAPTDPFAYYGNEDIERVLEEFHVTKDKTANE
jgi:hypothetical protein